jgi:hypothetical protein
MQFRRFARLTFYLRTLPESAIARLHHPGIDYRRERVGAALDVEKDKEVPFDELPSPLLPSTSTPFCVTQSWCSTWSIHSLGGHCAFQDGISLPGAQETCRLVAPRRIAVLGRLIPPHLKAIWDSLWSIIKSK